MAIRKRRRVRAEYEEREREIKIFRLLSHAENIRKYKKRELVLKLALSLMSDDWFLQDCEGSSFELQNWSLAFQISKHVRLAAKMASASS